MRAPLRLAGLDDHDGVGQRGDDPVAGGEAPRGGLDAGLVLGDDAAGLCDPAGEFGVGGRVVAVDAAAEHGDRAPACVEGAAVCLGVDAAGEAGDDRDAGGGEVAGERARDLGAVAGTGACADDGDGRRVQRGVDVLAARVELVAGRVGKLVEASVPDARVAVGGGCSSGRSLLSVE